ncbi:hypothetical protein ACFYNA_15585 [Streptomyces sp. NPDC006640]
MTQDTLFPLTDLKTEGYAQPETGQDADTEGQAAETVDNAGAEAA